MADDFFEEDEPVEDVVAAFNAGEKQLTKAPDDRDRTAELLLQETRRQVLTAFGVDEDGKTNLSRVFAAEALIAEWHYAPKGSDIAKRQLHEHLGMTWEEYKVWVERGLHSPTPVAPRLLPVVSDAPLIGAGDAASPQAERVEVDQPNDVDVEEVE